ncbi:MAG: hypothetical protein AB1349_00670 [Elusimicrobiota bacterium]
MSLLIHLSTYSLIHCLPYHTITVDGDLSDWADDEVLIDDSADFSEWQNNEINRVYLTWDKNNLYVGIDGKSKDTGLLIFFDFKAGGYSDLTKIDTWNRKVIFQNNGIDYFYGSWSGSDGNFYEVQSATHAYDISISKKHSTGWEFAIPFDTVYKLGSGKVPKNASVSIFASLATGDMGSELIGGTTVNFGYLVGDCTSTDTITGLSISTITTVTAKIFDADSDGVPDDNYSVTKLKISDVNVSPNPFSPDNSGFCDKTSISFSLSKPARIKIAVYDIAGRHIKDITDEEITDTTQKITKTWDGKNGSQDVVNGGIYFFNIQATSGSESTRKNKAVAVIK